LKTGAVRVEDRPTAAVEGGEHHARQSKITHDRQDGGITPATQRVEHGHEWNRYCSAGDRDRCNRKKRRNQQ
jgi:hypothetical protein